MDGQKQQVAERLKQANNILVTVSSNPSVDQLAACISLTIALNKMKKHATAVFSGTVPSTIEFLQPEKTLEKNTDSLRDFIIALDKSKADKLRYKIEDKVVKIFITPYKTSISEKDLQFSEGDFNVDVVLGLGIHNQADLDQAITAHGRILHDATVISLNITPGSEIGSINILDPQASSLSELVYGLLRMLDPQLIDNQIATALLTGIVAETGRFRNSKTSPMTMSVSAELLSAGANQQLVASKLEEPTAPQQTNNQATKPQEANQAKNDKVDDGTLEIQHDETGPVAVHGNSPVADKEKENASQIHIDDEGEFHPFENKQNKDSFKPSPPPLGLPNTPFPGPSPFAPPPLSNTPPPPLSSTPPPPPPSVFTPPPLSSTPPPPPPVAMPDDDSTFPTLPPPPPPPPPAHIEGPRMVLQPPTFESQLTANAYPMGFPPEEDDTSLPKEERAGPLLNREPLQPQPVGPTVNPPSDSPPPLGLPNTPFPGPSPFAPPPLSNTPPPPMASPPPPPQSVFTPPPLSSTPPPPPPEEGDKNDFDVKPQETLSDIEKDVDSVHLDYIESPIPKSQLSQTPPPPPQSVFTPPPLSSTPPPPSDNQVSDRGVSGAAPSDIVTPTTEPQVDLNLNEAREAVDEALSSDPNSALEPIQSLNAQDLGNPLHENDANANPPEIHTQGSPPLMPPEPPAGDQQPPSDFASSEDMPSGGASNNNHAAPPPVPPPMIPPMPPL